MSTPEDKPFDLEEFKEKIAADCPKLMETFNKLCARQHVPTTQNEADNILLIAMERTPDYPQGPIIVPSSGRINTGELPGRVDIEALRREAEEEPELKIEDIAAEDVIQDLVDHAGEQPIRISRQGNLAFVGTQAAIIRKPKNEKTGNDDPKREGDNKAPDLKI